MAERQDPSIARNLGAFFGHIAHAIRTDPDAPQKREVKRTTTEEKTPDGVILRRTTIDEVVLPPDAKPGQPNTNP
ncbi:MAG: hypothetical protein U0636_05360 [Phycisphaerales bacterium]